MVKKNQASKNQKSDERKSEKDEILNNAKLEDDGEISNDNSNKGVKADSGDAEQLPVKLESAKPEKSVDPEELNNVKSVGDAVKLSNSLITVRDIVDALSIILHSSKNINEGQTLDFITLKDMQVELPQELDRMPVELYFIGDRLGRWCVMYNNIRFTKGGDELVDEYVHLIFHLHHVLEGTAKEFFRLFRIKTKVSQGVRTILSPIYLGLDETFNKVGYDPLIRTPIDHWELFDYVNRGEFDDHFVFLHPCLHDFHLRTQRFLFASDIGLRDWMIEFGIRKRIVTAYGAHVIYGENRVKWGTHSAPRTLARFLSELPNFNQLSVGYSASFCMPDCSLSEIDLTQLTQTMRTSISRAEPLTDVLMSPENDRNYDDFRRILTAFTFPGQVMIEIEYPKDVNVALSGFTSCCAKLLFSTTPGFQNIEKDSALSADIYIGYMLGDLGYATVAGDPLNVQGTRFADPQLWYDLRTRDNDGSGWINSGVDASVILNRPLYDGITVVPAYGGMTQLLNMDNIVDANQVQDSPIFDLLCRNLQNARGDAITMKRVLQFNRSKYITFLMNLNRHLYHYGETGFRLTDERRNEMIPLFSGGGLNTSMNTPIKLKIAYDSVYKFFLRLPVSFAPNALVIRQPICESATNAELQRIFSLFLTLRDWIRRDGRHKIYTLRRIMKLVVQSIESNHIAKKIFDYCFERGDIQRLRVDKIEDYRPLFDDFEAVFIPELSKIVFDNLEVFGLTSRAVYRHHTVPIPRGAEYLAREAEGIIVDNSLQNEHEYTFTLDELSRRLSQLELLTVINDIQSKNDLVVTLPIYSLYREYRGTTWMKETDAWTIKVPLVGDLNFGCKESITPGTFTRQYILPSVDMPSFPDLLLLNGPYLKFWYLGTQTLTKPYTANLLSTYAVPVRSLKDYVLVKSPLAYDCDVKG